MQIKDHAETALEHVDRADQWANRDNVMPEHRATMVDQELRLAQIHAQLATAQRLDTFIDLMFDQGRAVHVVGYNGDVA